MHFAFFLSHKLQRIHIPIFSKSLNMFCGFFVSEWSETLALHSIRCLRYGISRSYHKLLHTYHRREIFPKPGESKPSTLWYSSFKDSPFLLSEFNQSSHSRRWSWYIHRGQNSSSRSLLYVTYRINSSITLDTHSMSQVPVVYNTEFGLLKS